MRDLAPVVLLCFLAGAACAPIGTGMPIVPTGIEREPSDFCSGSDGALADSSLTRKYIVTPPAGFFTARGVIGESVFAESGERLELRWEGFFPRYRLYYFALGEKQGVAIGRCHFSQGCNKLHYLFHDINENGIPDAFYVIEYESLDFGYDEETPGYLDRYRHIYVVAEDRYCVIHDLLFYRCSPPVSSPSKPCETFCSPPYRTTEIGGRPVPLVYRPEVIQYGALLNSYNRP